MGLFKKIVGIGSSKNDVKIAKLELEKAKVENKAKNEKASRESEFFRKQEVLSAVEGYLKYCKKNFISIKNKVLALKKEIETGVSNLKRPSNVKLSYRESAQRDKDRALCKSKLQYLYLSNDFLLFIAQFAIGVNINEEQAGLIFSFSRYFDGVKVIEVEENGGSEDVDVSLFGMVKEAAKDFAEVFYKPSSSLKSHKLSLIKYLQKYYSERIDQLEIPDIDAAIESFEKAMLDSNDGIVPNDSAVEVQSVAKCPNCNTEVLPNVKFCPECGSKIASPQPSVCKGCGSELLPGTKFCPECGQKTN